MLNVLINSNAGPGYARAGLPAGYPVWADDVSQPAPAGAQQMSEAAFAGLKASFAAEYSAFAASAAAADAAAVAASKDAAEPDLATLKNQAQAALDANAVFLAIGSPNNAQTLAQVQALTQQQNRVIKALWRLVLKAL